MTNYDAGGFANRFRTSRPIALEVEQLWASLLQAALPSDVVVKTALDLGAGTGRFWPTMRRAWHPTRIMAIDRSLAMLSAGALGSDVEAIVKDMDDETIAEYRAEAVLCSMSLHYSSNPSRLCARLRLVLAPRGVICVRTASRETIEANAVLKFFPTAIRAELSAFPERAVIEQWLSDSGFVVSSEVVRTPAASNHRQLVCQAIRRGLPSLQLVSKVEFVLGISRLVLWAAVRMFRRLPVPLDKTLLVVGVTT